MKPLSETQRKTVAKMEKNEWYSAYDLQVSLSTLDALVKRKVLIKTYELGCMYSPRTSIQYRLSDKKA